MVVVELDSPMLASDESIQGTKFTYLVRDYSDPKAHADIGDDERKGSGSQCDVQPEASTTRNDT